MDHCKICNGKDECLLDEKKKRLCFEENGIFLETDRFLIILNHLKKRIHDSLGKINEACCMVANCGTYDMLVDLGVIKETEYSIRKGNHLKSYELTKTGERYLEFATRGIDMTMLLNAFEENEDYRKELGYGKVRKLTTLIEKVRGND